MNNWKTYLQIAISLFVIADPIGAIPIFITLTERHSEKDRKRIASVAASSVALVLIASLFLGQPLLQFFGINIASFRVAGGILIMIMAIAMLQARHSRAHHAPEEAEEAVTKEDAAVVPLAIPLIAGPGAISTIIIYAHQAITWLDTIALVIISLVVATSVWSALRLADPIRRLLGTTGINVVTRLLGLILAAVAVEFIATGLAQLLPGLAGQVLTAPK
ncbi:MAG: YchE family NAAT transporter [Candidatus Binataceae bacterium]